MNDWMKANPAIADVLTDLRAAALDSAEPSVFRIEVLGQHEEDPS